MTSCRRFVAARGLRRLSGSTRKSDIRKVMLRRFTTRFIVSRADSMDVPLPSGVNTSRSRTILNTCLLPFLGGTISSGLSVNIKRPTLSLFVVAAKDSTAANSAANSRLNCPVVPKSDDPLASTARKTVSSRSSWYFRM